MRKMNIARWNIMGLVLFALLANSSLAQAETITSLSPTRVQPGQVVMLQGRFNAAKYRNRQYRFSLNKRRTPRRPPGAINGFIETLRVTSTTAVVRIPATWQRKPVYPSEYVLSIKDAPRNRTLFNGIPINVINNAALGAAKGKMRDQIKLGQQQRLGGNLGQMARPRLPAARGAPQMKLTLKDLKVNNQSVISRGVSVGDQVVVAFDIKNTGTLAGQVKVGYINRGRPQSTSHGFVTVGSGKTVSMLLNVRINTPPADQNVHSLRGVNGLYWSPIFALLTTRNTPYQDSNMADNLVRGGALANIAVSSKVDLAIVSINGVTLIESWRGGGRWDYGTVHPVSLEAIIKVKNNGTQTSLPTKLGVTVIGKQSAHADIERDRGVTRHLVGRCAHWPVCTMNQNLSIAAIPAGQTVAFRVHFTNIPHNIVISRKKGRAKVALGPYICGRNKVAGVIAGHMSISGFLRNAAVNEARPLRKDNYLTQKGRFSEGAQSATQVTCRFENSSIKNKRP